MRFFMPVDTYIEKNCVKNHKDDIAKIGSKALIVTGRSSAKKNGSLDDVTGVLEECGIPYEIFAGVEENPSVDTVEKAAEAGKAFGADFLVGIGGGSAIDAAKAIGLLIANPEETKDSLYVLKDLPALPVVAVPTTCGTGSETTAVSVLTRHDVELKKSIPYKIFPQLALVDGAYLMSAGKNLLVNTAVDALAHSVESYLHVKGNTYNRMMSAYAMQLWKDEIPVLKGDQELDEDMAEHMMMVSTIAGMAIAQTATSLPHAMSYEVTFRKGIPHGKACGIFLAAYMKEYAKNKPEDVEQILGFLGMKDLDAFDALLTELVGKPELSEAEMKSYAENVSKDKGKIATYPFEITFDGIERIYRDSLTIV